MAQGTVLWFDSEKGFGFIEQDGGGPDVFVDYLELAGVRFRSLRERQRVTFDLRHSKSGPGAVGDRLIGRVPPRARGRRLRPEIGRAPRAERERRQAV